MTGETLYQRRADDETVACWHCGALCRIHLAPSWGLCWICNTATGTDGRMYRLVHQNLDNYPQVHPCQWKAVEINTRQVGARAGIAGEDMVFPDGSWTRWPGTS